MFLAGCGSDAAAPAEPARFVGRASCSRCHEAELEAYRGSHHDLAMQEARPDTVLGDFDGATFEKDGVTSSFTTRDGKFVVRTDGVDGTLQDFEVRYAFGVTPLQQYLVDIGRGRLQALQLAWDSRPADQGGQRWFHLYPDEQVPHGDPLHWTGGAMNWNFMCASCHSTDLRRGYDSETDSYASTWSEIDVSCEACHGPGSRHVAWADGGETSSDPTMGLAVQPNGVAQWVFEPGANTARRSEPLERQVEVETCAPCHSRRAQASEAPWHGDAYLDHYHPSLLEPGLYHADGQILDEVYVWGSFVQSRMHAAGVTCSDCHDPHSLQLRAAGNALCARCHVQDVYDRKSHHLHEPGTAGSACVDCHMPERTYMVVDPRRDHSMRIPRPDLTVAIGTPNACQTCHADQGARWAADAVLAGRGDRPGPKPSYARALHDGRIGKPRARTALVALANDSAAPAIARATALRLLGQVPGSLDPGAVRAAFADPDPLLRFGAAELLADLPEPLRIELGAPLLGDPVRAVRAEAGRALAVSALPSEQRAARDAALADWIVFQQTNIDQPWAHVNLGVLALAHGDLVAAERAYRHALRVAPHSVQARINLSDLLRERERDDLGEQLLREGIAMLPEIAELHHALGLLLARRGATADAVEELAAAARLQPGTPRFAYVHAVGLESVAGVDAAIPVLEEALARHPWDADLLLGISSFLQKRGEIARALEFAERLATVDPAAASLVDELRAARR
jgi:predicted CXXCH cytochrome family protein